MKIVLLFAVVAFCSCIAFSGCDKAASPIVKNFTVEGPQIVIEVPPSTATGSYTSIGTASIVWNLDSIIKAQTRGAMGLKDIDEFKFHSCKLTILNAEADNNFDAFSDVRLYFSTTANSSQTLLGEVNNNPDSYADTLNIPINNTTNMKAYIPTSGLVTINFDLGGQMRKTRSKTTTVSFSNPLFDIRTKY